MRRGFTLIELLVVIAIIAILAAILFPVFLRVRQTAYQTKCQTHGKQLGLAMSMYMDDHDGRFPSEATSDMLAQFQNVTWQYIFPGVTTWGVSSSNQYKFIQFAPYVKNLDIWICPSPNSLHAKKYAYGYRLSWAFLLRKFMYGSDATTYPDTPFQYQDSSPQKRWVGRTFAEVQALDISDYSHSRSSSKKIIAFCYALGPDVPVEVYAGGPIEPCLFPHNEGTVYVYCDGHAKWSETGCGWAPVGYTNTHIDRPHPHL